ncbi:restriction endonuclease subunit S [Kitasatospora sp. NPDC004614]|uniref:restriction endonuclease subunit S n=1 Tax=unclassified Kitasatospora TaxID=2633591 RepID=UPI0036B9DD5D
MSISTVKLADAAEINPRLTDRPHEHTIVSFLGMADVSERGTTGKGADREFGEVSKGYTQFANGDLLVAKITPCFENGKIAQANLAHARGAGSTEFHVVRPDESRFDSRFLLHFLRQPIIRLQGEARMTGSAGQRRVPEAFLADLAIPDMPLPMQNRIAALLDHVDALRIKRRRALGLLDDIAQSIFIDMFGDPATNPKSWPIRKVADLVDSTTYGTSAKADLSGTIPVLRMNNLTRAGEIDLSDLKYMDHLAVGDRHIVRQGDVLFNRTNSADLVGKTAIYRREEPVAYAGYLVRVRMNSRNHPEYLAAFMNTPYAKRVLRNMCKSIIGMANINANELKSIDIAEPPLRLQQEFADRMLAVEKLKLTHRAHLAELDRLFASIRHRAFRSELWSDEGASALTSAT